MYFHIVFHRTEVCDLIQTGWKLNVNKKKTPIVQRIFHIHSHCSSYLKSTPSCNGDKQPLAPSMGFAPGAAKLCRSFVPGSPAASRRARLLAFAGGRLACYQCASSSVAPAQSIVPLLCSRRLSGRSMPELKHSHTRAHAAAAAATAAQNTTYIFYPRQLRVFVRRPTETGRVYDTHNDALAPNAARMRSTRRCAVAL